MTRWLFSAILILATHACPSRVDGQVPDSAADKPGCLACHLGIEPIRDPESDMMRQIRAMGRGRNAPDGCVVCHGGNPTATTTEDAHGGEGFYPDPGSPWINEFTCGPCHVDHVEAQW
ncbi:MAG: cytochrome C, partial [Phycisphaerae bacterium]